MTDWTELHLAHWDERAAPHAASAGYAVQRFRDDPECLSDAMESLPGGEYCLADRPWRLAHSYTIQAVKA